MVVWLVGAAAAAAVNFDELRGVRRPSPSGARGYLLHIDQEPILHRDALV